jgi:pyruvate,water dikinase
MALEEPKSILRSRMTMIRLFKRNRSKTEFDISEIKRNFESFLRLLDANNEALKLMNELEEKSSGEYLFDMEFIKSNLDKLDSYMGEIVSSLNQIGENRYGDLEAALNRIRNVVNAALPGGGEIQADAGVIPFEQLDISQLGQVGSKSANLGELRNRLRLPVPDGFAVTASGWRSFMEHNQLKAKVQSKLDALDLKDLGMLRDTSRDIQEMIQRSEIPRDLQQKVESAVQGISGADEGLYSVRSSALGEDTQFSFAGQYASYLNVRPEQILDSYRNVVASQFTPGAMYYYLCQGMREHEVAMSVACMRMVDGRAAGVMYTTNPVDPDEPALIVNAVWGLGKYVVDGVLTPDSFLVSKETLEVVGEEVVDKSVQLVTSAEGGVSEMAVPEEDRLKPSLTAEQIRTLGEYAVKIENHYGEPQDIEWVIDRDGQIYLMQSRPLRVYRKTIHGDALDLSHHRVLVEDGVTAASGAGGGKVYHLRGEEDLPSCPDGAVIVSRTPFPALTTVMSRVNAIVTEVGAITGHMATVAREFRIPTLMGVRAAFELLPNGSEVTVDADDKKVYDSFIEELVSQRAPEENIFEDTALFVTLERVLRHIVPLNLVSPRAPNFKAENCQTYHDITRFAHQRSLDEIFKVAESGKEGAGSAPLLDTEIPLRINILTVDKNAAHMNAKKKISEDEIPSLPMQSFWDGVKETGWPHPPPVSAKGFVSVLATSAIGGEKDRSGFSENSFALVAAEYMVFSVRMGYHFSTIESMCTDTPEKNYIRMKFQSGGASIDRRKRRVRLIINILKDMGFENESKGDFLDARVAYDNKEDVLIKLKRLGALSIHTKQLDMALSSDEVAAWYEEEIKRKLDNLSKEEPDAAKDTGRG